MYLSHYQRKSLIYKCFSVRSMHYKVGVSSAHLKCIHHSHSGNKTHQPYNAERFPSGFSGYNLARSE